MSKLIESDDLGNWSLKGVPWKSLYVGQVITKDIHDKVYGALWKLMEYENTGLSPEDVEKSQYILADAMEELEEHCESEQKRLVSEIKVLLEKFN